MITMGISFGTIASSPMQYLPFVRGINLWPVDSPHKKRVMWPWDDVIVFLVSLAAALFMITVGVLFGTITASRSMHRTLLTNMLRTPMSFFDTTPLGRIINRFSKDIDTLDDQLRMQIQFWMMQSSPIVATIIVISYTTPIFIAVVIPLIILFAIIQVSMVVLLITGPLCWESTGHTGAGIPHSKGQYCCGDAAQDTVCHHSSKHCHTSWHAILVTSWYRNTFRITGPMCGESITGGFPHKWKAMHRHGDATHYVVLSSR